MIASLREGFHALNMVMVKAGKIVGLIFIFASPIGFIPAVRNFLGYLVVWLWLLVPIVGISWAIIKYFMGV